MDNASFEEIANAAAAFVDLLGDRRYKRLMLSANEKSAFEVLICALRRSPYHFGARNDIKDRRYDRSSVLFK
jgi:hypothetical protein